MRVYMTLDLQHNVSSVKYNVKYFCDNGSLLPTYTIASNIEARFSCRLQAQSRPQGMCAPHP